tara:strand:+ start:432 stop:800 length:369 start_codon:yes stop_codon:yes gene_type:complete
MELVLIKTVLTNQSKIISLEDQEELNNKKFYFSEISGNNYLQLNLDKGKINNNIHFVCILNKGIMINNISVSGVLVPIYLNNDLTETKNESEFFRKQSFFITNDNENINIFSYIKGFYNKLD